jgi:hypothetical protein
VKVEEKLQEEDLKGKEKSFFARGEEEKRKLDDKKFLFCRFSVVFFEDLRN